MADTDKPSAWQQGTGKVVLSWDRETGELNVNLEGCNWYEAHTMMQLGI